MNAHPNAEPIGERIDGVLPPLIPNVDARQTDDICFGEESFCGLVAQTTLPGANVAEYLSNAVEFCNNTLWGTLNVGLIIDPRIEKRFSKEFDQAIADLEYGTVAINHWAGLGYGFGCTAWGAYQDMLETISRAVSAKFTTHIYSISG